MLIDEHLNNGGKRCNTKQPKHDRNIEILLMLANCMHSYNGVEMKQNEKQKEMCVFNGLLDMHRIV